MSLADQLADAIEEEELAQVDEFGTSRPDPDPVTGTIDPRSLVDYLVGRAINLTQDLNNPYANTGLHRVDDKLYLGNRPLDENDKTFYELTKYLTAIPAPVKAIFWINLKEVVPVLDKRFIQVSRWTFWDKEEGRLVRIEEVEKYVENQVKKDNR